MKCDSGYFFDISGLFRGSSRCYGIFSGFLHYGLDELDRGSIVGSIEILGLFDWGSMVRCKCHKIDMSSIV